MPVRIAALSIRERLLGKSGEASFRSTDSGGTLKVDLAAGMIRRVSLLTGNREATGWCMWVDAKTVAMFADLLSGRKLKAYATHGQWGGDGTLDEVGLWTEASVDGENLRADFSALDAWKKYSEQEYATLFELATKAPEEFGASLSFRYTLAWVRTTGEDVPTEIVGWNYDDQCPLFDPSAPSDAVRSDLPSVRPVSVKSADFVDDPAANDGLFRAGEVDGAGKGNSRGIPPPTSKMDIKTLQAEFGSKPNHLARAVALFSANDKLTVGEIRATIGNEEQTAELAQLRAAHSSAGPQLLLVDAAGFKAKDGKSAVEILLAEHAAFKSAAASRDTEVAALKAAGFEAKDGKSAGELLLAAFKQKVDDIATLKAGGHLPIETGTPPAEGAKPGTAGLTGARRAGAAFNAQFAAKPTGNN